jgi:hypothetical protein
LTGFETSVVIVEGLAEQEEDAPGGPQFGRVILNRRIAVHRFQGPVGLHHRKGEGPSDLIGCATDQFLIIPYFEGNGSRRQLATTGFDFTLVGQKPCRDYTLLGGCP